MNLYRTKSYESISFGGGTVCVYLQFSLYAFFYGIQGDQSCGTLDSLHLS